MDFNPSQSASPPIGFAEAISIVSAQAAAVLAASSDDQEKCDLNQVLGRVLSTALIADRDQPPFHRVTRDGFAVRAADIAARIPLRVAGRIRAGETSQLSLNTGEAIEIMTGAPLPPGADAVLMIEHTEGIAGGQTQPAQVRPIQIQPIQGKTLAPGENVVVQGSEAKKGDVVLEAGTRLLPDEIALAASCGLRDIPVFPRPTVAILPTGDELYDAPAGNTSGPSSVIGANQIYDSNSYSLAALVQHAGAIPVRRTVAQDTRSDLAARIQEALHLAPLLLLTGGVSAGRYDLVEEVLAGMEAKFLFTGVRMQPGKPVVFGSIPASKDWPQRFFFGLPGNPVSAMVTFRVFVRPLLAALSGERNWQPDVTLASLGADVRYQAGLTRFIPARLQTSHSSAMVVPVPNRGSGDLAANARANCYLIVPEDCAFLARGQLVQILLR